MSMRFRPLLPEDAEVFYQMSEEFYHSPAVLHPIPASYHRTAFREMMASDCYLSGYLFLADSAAAGFAVTNRMMQHEAGGILVWVEELYVRPAYQGKGLGSRFLTWLEQQLQGKAAAIRLETEPENVRAKKLYERLGYESIGYAQMIKQLNTQPKK